MPVSLHWSGSLQMSSLRESFRSSVSTLWFEELRSATSQTDTWILETVGRCFEWRVSCVCAVCARSFLDEVRSELRVNYGLLTHSREFGLVQTNCKWNARSGTCTQFQWLSERHWVRSSLPKQALCSVTELAASAKWESHRHFSFDESASSAVRQVSLLLRFWDRIHFLFTAFFSLCILISL